jgi:hypothetical protein
MICKSLTRESMAHHLVRLLTDEPTRALPIKEAKRRFCGDTTPIGDLHAAVGYAEVNGWIAYSRDYLNMTLRPRGLAVAAAASS